MKSFYSGVHRDYDISPHNEWQESEQICSGVTDGSVAPITEGQSLEKTKEAANNSEFMEDFEKAEDDLEEAKKWKRQVSRGGGQSF